MILKFNKWKHSNYVKNIIKILHEGCRVVKTSALNESSNAMSFAKQELDLLLKNSKESLLKDFIPEILALVDKFGNSGQSGGSAPYTANAITNALKDLLLFKPINPIMNTTDEWDDDAKIENIFQNKRCFGVFKEGKNGKPYYIDAIVWKTPKDHTYTGSAKLNNETIKSKQYIKEFPFKPKTFVIDVDEKEIAPDDWEFTIKDPSQLEDVFKYYEKQ